MDISLAIYLNFHDTLALSMQPLQPQRQFIPRHKSPATLRRLRGLSAVLRFDFRADSLDYIHKISSGIVLISLYHLIKNFKSHLNFSDMVGVPTSNRCDNCRKRKKKVCLNAICLTFYRPKIHLIACDKRF